MRDFDLKASRNWCSELSLPFLSFFPPCSSFLICMVISARSNWCIDPLNPVSGERSCKPELRPVSFKLPVSLYYSSASPPQHRRDRSVYKNMTGLCDARLDLLSAVFVAIEFLGITPCGLVKYRHFGGVCLHLQGCSRNWPEDRNNRLLRNAGRFTS